MASPIVTYPSRKPPAMGDDATWLEAVLKMAGELMKYMKEDRSDIIGRFLDCHKWPKYWAERLEAVHGRMGRQAAADGRGPGGSLPLMMQIQIDFLRKETKEGVSGGEHVALLVSLPGCWLLIDHTHNQFDLPMDFYEDRAAVRTRCSDVWNAMKTHIERGPSMEGVVANWLTFLASKRYVREVSRSNIGYYPGNYDFDSHTAMNDAARGGRRGWRM